MPVDVVVWVDVKPKPTHLAWAKTHGLALNVMIHGDSTDRTSNRFEVSSWVPDVCTAIRDAGIELELTAWAQPHSGYLAGACEWLTEATVRHGVRCVWWDAEEPWTRAKHGLEPQAAADLINLAGAREGVTGIGYAPRSLDPLLARADIVSPQVYATHNPGSLSLRAIPGILEGWRRRAPAAELQPALAAYAQGDAEGLARAWGAAGRPHKIQVWALRHLAARPELLDRLRAASES